ncbi:ABC transporter ATP-binding protein [Corynebacterium sp. 320]|uniref:ABC transporter ATP-binding protein n=1 Tax=Corynebacterium zhongnanshanii TaxID=2768834 RepID=A0ABQ6VLQ5_9CORY|nr:MULTISPECIES: ABC transporter ATP-binding protein [Corynebacterium]KAB1503768.1 ABC transporter ATP-binding protein [Corynebacterium sp. 320]KAB1553132.1 ABC transporter ATP-binding protein [Corynebacterium sp. 321]KAB1553650.1 ABC transporter ATP-binding protein [Corynebacterium sp. 319]KAB3523381.1 ABC transporter ATP-binding protein [Corynebacterium zhongnanshanii]KAB3527904.1 ABC transporter ATP-binding protein [Corynebacterium sp. 250]
MPTLTFTDAEVRVHHPTPRTILSPLTLTLTEHRIGIIGTNGSGKSTFVRLINGLTKPTAGSVTVNGTDVARHSRDVRRQVGFIFSDADNQIIMPTVEEDIALSLRRFKLPQHEVRTRTKAVMERLGLTHLADASPHSLSGGEKQLLALASVLVMEPSVIVADEPSTFLDLKNRRRVSRTFSALDQQMLVISHDLDFIHDYDRILCFEDSRLVDDSLHSSPGEVIERYVERQEAEDV